MGSEIHLALRFDAEWWPNPSLKVNTVQTHQDVINQHGDVWWGKFGRGISDSKFEDIKNQIDQHKSTSNLSSAIRLYVLNHLKNSS